MSRKWIRVVAPILMIVMLLAVTRSNAANEIWACTVDSGGSNDEPGQGDMSQMCTDINPENATYFGVKWDWDDAKGPGGNTYYACSLFDTDADSNINYAVCIQLLPDADNILRYSKTELYACSDAKPDRCTQPTTAVLKDYCTATQANTDPFPPVAGIPEGSPGGAGSAYPADTVGQCSIPNDDVGGTTAVLVNVCSYTSQANPNSDPKDCIAPTGAAYLTVAKVAYPNETTQAFDFTITGPAGYSQNPTIYGTGASPRYVVSPGTYSVSEPSVPTGWDLTGSVCKDQFGTILGTGGGTNTISNITIGSYKDVVCTFTDTKRGSIIVEKQTDPDGADGSFTFTGDAAGTISDGQQIVVSDLKPGTYTSTESDPTPGFYLSSITCDDGGSANPSTGNLTTRTATFKLDPGETVKCTFTNQARVDLAVTKSDGDVWKSVGDQFEYVINVNYASTSGTGGIAYNVSLVDTLDPWLKYVGNLSVDDPNSLGTSCEAPTPLYPDGGGGTLTCDLKKMTQGQNIQVRFTVEVLPGVPLASLVEIDDSPYASVTCSAVPNRTDANRPISEGDVCNQVSVSTTSVDVNLANNTDSEPKDIKWPTQVTLASFTATGLSRAIQLDWVTTNEVDNLGFNLYRATKLTGVRTKINAQLIPSLQPPGSIDGAIYQYIDIVQPGRVYYYWLEDVDIYGQGELHGPVSAKALK